MVLIIKLPEKSPYWMSVISRLAIFNMETIDYFDVKI